MKLRNILGVTLCAFILGSGFTSCSNDDDDKKADPAILSGTFKFAKSEALVEVSDPEVKDKVVEAVNAYSKGGTYAFKLDGTFESKESAEASVIEGTYKLEGEKLTLTTEDETNTMTYANDSIRNSQDVAKKVAEELELEEGIVTKAVLVDIFEKITK